MKRWMTETVADTPTALEIVGYHENKKSPRTQFKIVLEKNLQEAGAYQIYRGRIVVAEGTTEKVATRLISHLVATSQMRVGITVVL